MAFYLRPYEDLRNGQVQVNTWSWTSLVGGFFSILPAGSLYCFALYGPVFHRDFVGLTALQLNLVSAFGWLGAAVASFPAGIVVDTWGPVIPLAISAVLSFLGYLLLFLLLRKDIAYNFGGLLMSYFIVGIGVQLTTIAILSCNIKNFPSSARGRVLGLMGLAIALAGSFYGSFFRAFFTGRPEDFLLFLGICNGLLCLVGVAVISVPKEKSYSKNWKKMLSDALGSPKAENREGFLSSSESQDLVWRPRKLFGDLKFWLIFCIGFFGLSVPLMFLSVMLGSVYTSHYGPQGGQAWAVIFGGIANACGRLFGGIVSDSTLHLFKRPMWAFPCYGFMGIGLVLMMTIQSYDIVLPASILIGLGYGGLAGGIFPGIICDIFGVTHYAKNYSLLQPAYPLGFLVWGQVAGYLYEQQSPGAICLGFHCFENVFIFMLLILGVAVGATLSLTLILPPIQPQRAPPPSERPLSYFVKLNDEIVPEENDEINENDL